MFELNNFSILVGTKYLVKDLSVTLNKNDKLAIIGEEGNGKSTLLKSILGLCSYSSCSGTVKFYGNKVGYLPQSFEDEILNKTVFEYLFIDDEDYYNKINDFYKNINELALTDDKLNIQMKFLSGGEKVKFAILKLLLEENDILFLDEPTNDLDIETLEWLERFINNSKKLIVYISHDETLLSNTANMILHLELIKHKMECRHTVARSSYDEYVQSRISKIAKDRQSAEREKREFDKKEQKLSQIMNRVEYQQNTISRGDPHGARLLKKKMHSLKSQEKKLDETVLTEVPDLEEEINFFFEDVFIPPTKVILDLSIPVLKINEKALSININLTVKGQEHIVIVGTNGVGKSTLLKLIYDILKDKTDIKLGYMPQNYSDLLKDYDFVLDYLTISKEKDDITKSRMYLGNMNFTKEEMSGKISSLSNGSVAKLFLTKFVLEKYNVLLLDEPTRNVSPLSNPVIRKVLKEFKGTIISISHDRKYIDEVADIVYLLDKNGLIEIKKCDI